MRTFGFMNSGSAPPFNPFTDTFDGTSGNETVPSGASQLVVEGEGSGGNGFDSPTTNNGRGGGGGAYVKKTVAIVASDWGKLLAYVSGSGSGVDTTITINGLNAAPSNLTAHTGSDGTGISSGGAGGTASGGDTNTSGTSAASVTGGAGAATLGGAGGGQGAEGTIPGGGGGGNRNSNGAGAGAVGRIKFAWT